MRSIICLTICLVLTAGCAAPPTEPKSVNREPATVPATVQPDESRRIVQLVNDLLQQYHLEPHEDHMSLSRTAIEVYLTDVDPQRMYLLQSDVDALRAAHRSWGQALLHGDLEPCLEQLPSYQQRQQERSDFAQAFLTKGQPATVATGVKANGWAPTMQNLDERWRLRLAAELAAAQAAGVRLEQARELLKSVYAELPRTLTMMDANEHMGFCLNVWVKAYDDLSAYLPAVPARRTSNQSGVGLQLQQTRSFIEIVSMVPGGAAVKHGGVFAGDQVLALGEGEGPLKHAVGRLADVVEDMGGRAGSELRLLLRREDAEGNVRMSLVSLQRGEMDLSEALWHEVFEVWQEDSRHRIGLIQIPNFYIDFAAKDRGDRNYRSSSADLEHALRRLEGLGVEGVVLDLRGNGGGALSEVIDIAALLGVPGPVVIVTRANGERELLEAEQSGHRYEGPLVVLVDRQSASGTEMLTAALRDHGRAVVMGERTGGTGSIQTLVNLNRFVSNAEPGRLKLTIARANRVDGRSLEQLGVSPDLPLPVDKPRDNSPPPRPLAAVAVQPVIDSNSELDSLLPGLRDRHEARLRQADHVGPHQWVEYAAQVIVDLANQ